MLILHVIIEYLTFYQSIGVSGQTIPPLDFFFEQRKEKKQGRIKLHSEEILRPERENITILTCQFTTIMNTLIIVIVTGSDVANKAIIENYYR